MTRVRLGVCVLVLGAQACGGDVGEAVVSGDGEQLTPTFEVDPSWPTIPNNWVFGITSGLSIDADNNIWVLHRPRTVAPDLADRAAPPVMVFDTEGNFIKGWGGDGAGFEWPGTEHGVFVDHNDNVWISGSGRGDDQILKFTSDGEFIMQIGRAGQSGGNTDTQNVNRAADIYVYPRTNELFVADGYGNRRIIVFDAETGAICDGDQGDSVGHRCTGPGNDLRACRPYPRTRVDLIPGRSAGVLFGPRGDPKAPGRFAGIVPHTG